MKWIIILLIVFLSCSDSTSADGNDKENVITEIDAFDQNKLLQRTINLGNALEAPSLGEWGIVLEESFFTTIKDAGFSAVRIPCRWSAYTQEVAPYKIRSDFMNLVKWSVDQAEKSDLAAIINVHHFEEIFSNPQAEKERFLAIWEQIAVEFKDYPASLFFEILNEPHDNLTAELWNVYLQDAVDVIRNIDSTHTLIIGTAEWGGIDAMQKLRLPENENNMIFTFHYYSPFQFTHQGAEWVDGADDWLGTEWIQSESDIKNVQLHFSNVKEWADQYNIPVFLGEFGAYNKADINSRVRWTNFVSREAERNNFSWAYWEFCAGFGAYNLSQNKWNDQLLNALIP